MSKKPCNHKFITIFWMTLVNITLLIQMSKKYYPQIRIFFFLSMKFCKEFEIFISRAGRENFIRFSYRCFYRIFVLSHRYQQE